MSFYPQYVDHTKLRAASCTDFVTADTFSLLSMPLAATKGAHKTSASHIGYHVLASVSRHHGKYVAGGNAVHLTVLEHDLALNRYFAHCAKAPV